MKYWNVSVSVLDPDLHTARFVLARCPFLFTVGTRFSPGLHTSAHIAPVLAIAARDYPKRDLYPLLMQEAKSLCGMALVERWKSVEIVQAFALLAMFPPPSRRWEEDRSWMYLGCVFCDSPWSDPYCTQRCDPDGYGFRSESAYQAPVCERDGRAGAVQSHPDLVDLP